MSKELEQQARPWHREPWPWVIIGLLGSVVVAGVVTLWIAIANPDYLVVEETEYQQIKSELRAQSGSEEEQPDPGDG